LWSRLSDRITLLPAPLGIYVYVCGWMYVRVFRDLSAVESNDHHHGANSQRYKQTLALAH